jgi:predicted aldo/keto reductase-like oxidoreductase
VKQLFDLTSKKLGMGCMRLPKTETGEIDHAEFCRMVDAYLAAGFRYFDTAHGYHSGKSELALRECLVKRYPRDRFVLVNKLSHNYFNSREEIRPFFAQQLEWCGVEHFDLYLMHAQDARLYEKYKACHAYETALELQKEGKIDHFGISFHDKAAVLETILRDYPQIEVVQLQFNYADYDDASVEARKCYEVCVRAGKDVVVMEPVKGGLLAKLPPKAKEIFDALGDRHPASYAIRFAAGFEGVKMVLSGMGSLAMLEDNMAYMQDFRPLNEEEAEAVRKVQTILRELDQIPCTACRYCVDGCPKGILIPNLFGCLNWKKTWQDDFSEYYYGVHTQNAGKASDCIGCGRCERTCPQHLPIRALLQTVAAEFEKKDAE